MSSNKSYHPSDSSSEMDESVGRISEVEDEIDDEDKDKDGDEENEHEHEDDGEENGEDEKRMIGKWLALNKIKEELTQSFSPSLFQPKHVTTKSYLLWHTQEHTIKKMMGSGYPLGCNQAQLLATCQKLEEDLGQVQAERDATNAHCTIISRVVEETRKQLGVVTKEKQQGTGKIKAWFVTHPALKAHFDQEEAEHSGKAKERAAKDAQKAVDEAVHTARIHKDTVLKNFEKPLLSYKHKDDLITVAGALQLSTTWDGHGTPH
ncbi:hypothetical protein SERLA73DRAFT_153228 [Serpula lacrymans var. lacrymans S7.3]|uniref:Uncharacterized protein n=1 Tax=Serpula lacrymans var. lacrymans (strain S7.3) TaxID=936435 RepID=F8Q135_SERL3|nr:hypothetical protein SERLA73DRAFT_153228 [Serpula lacrymans var. lacrymans S7.3]